jgi:hypothetical protein
LAIVLGCIPLLLLLLLLVHLVAVITIKAASEEL